MVHCNIYKERILQTSFLNTISSTLAPWTALARDLTDSQTEHVNATVQLLSKGYDATRPDELSRLASQSMATGLTASVKAARLATAQVTELTGHLPTPAASLPGAELAKTLQGHATNAQEQFLSLLEKAAGALAPATPAARKPARA
jgi:hypothetical protein